MPIPIKFNDLVEERFAKARDPHFNREYKELDTNMFKVLKDIRFQQWPREYKAASFESLSVLEFHKMNSEFNASFDYKEYTSLKGTNDPNEGYQKILELTDLQDKQVESHDALAPLRHKFNNQFN